MKFYNVKKKIITIFINLNFKINTLYKKLCNIFNKSIYNSYFFVNLEKKTFFNFDFFEKKPLIFNRNILKIYNFLVNEKKTVNPDFFFIFYKNKVCFLLNRRKTKKRTIYIFKILKIILNLKKNNKKKFFFILKKNTKKKKNIYKKNFIKIKKLIKNGTLLQTQLSKINIAKTNLNNFDLFLLNKSKHKNIIFYREHKLEIICFSPEILIKIKKRKINTFPIAGTIERGKNIIFDKFLEKKLINDKKEISEHSMLIDLSRNDLNIFSLINSVNVNKKFLVKKYKNVQHIVSEVFSRFSKNTNFENIIFNISPSGTLSGAPKEISIKTIIKNNIKNNKINYNCDFFGGSIGFMNMNKCFFFLIIIRSLFIKKKYVFLKSSSGITIKSKIRNEYKELNEKMKIFLKKNDTLNR
ncbi:chorismate-binding protein [Candidatus Vidania fulgoroideorum]